MKKVITALAIIVSITLNACQFNHNSSSISIRTKDTENNLNFTANYPEEKTGAVQNYIERSFKEDRIFRSITDIKKVEIKLNDGTQFYLSYEPGYISINLARDRNSFTSYNRVKKMIAGFGKALKD